MKESGKVDSVTERESRFGLMAPGILETGGTTRPTERESSSMLTVTFTRATGPTTRPTVVVLTST